MSQGTGEVAFETRHEGFARGRLCNCAYSGDLRVGHFTENRTILIFLVMIKVVERKSIRNRCKYLKGFEKQCEKQSLPFLA